MELAVSSLYYISRVLILPGLHPDIVLIIYCLRIQLSTTVTLVLVFIPKFWYQQKQVRSLAQEYSCRIPVDAFKVFFLIINFRYELFVYLYYLGYKRTRSTDWK